MRLRMFARLGRGGRRLVWGGALGVLLLAAGTTAIGDVSPEAKRARSQDNSFSLFAGPTAVLTGNQLQCGLNNQGYICTDVFDSPTGGGGFWPVGSPNAYIFNTGLQIAGIIQEDGGPWANDTTAAFFFDPKGTTQHGSALTSIYDSLNPDDLANWPDEAKIADGDPLFQPVLWGRNTASQQDSWVQYWDGDPARIAGRIHPLGVKVTQRSLAWNYPAGNESLIYFIYKFENVTDSEEFLRLNNTQFFGGDAALPASGYTIGELYGAFGTDMDVSDATENFSTAVLPFDVGISYTGGFNAPEFAYTPDIFFPPFFTDAPGLIGIKYLRSPIRPGSDPPEEVGLTLFSANLNASFGFPDPQNDKQLWRYLSGKVNPSQGDNPCNVEPEVLTADPNLTERSVCFIYQESADTRFFQSSGPFELGPEDAPATIVVAYIAAATVERMPDGSLSGILANQSDANSNAPGDPSFHPGYTSARACSPTAVADADPNGCADVRTPNPVKPIERGAGWYEYNGPAPSGRVNGFLEGPDNKLDQFSVSVVPNSLLGRALVAQTIFDSSFLLGFAPEAPVFYLVPGDDNVTVLWQESATETAGDPFFQVAGDVTSPLYNPNYREFDVEGYRVWRGTNPGALSLIAQFDKADTQFFDYTCETVAPDEDVGTEREGTPVVGYVAGETCPFEAGVSFIARNIDNSMIFNNGSDGGLPGAGAARLADGSAIGSSLTTAVIDDVAGPAEPLTDSGIPFFFVDPAVTNNFTYYYSVTAFDVNSQASGPHTLRSARIAQSTVPRKDAPDVAFAELEVATLGDDGEPLNPNAPVPSIDPADGTFSGPMPPTNGVELSFAPAVARLLPEFTRAAKIDSIVPQYLGTGGCAAGVNDFDACWKMYLTVDEDGVLSEVVVDGNTTVWNRFGAPAETQATLVASTVPFDPDALRAFGIPSGAGFATAIATFNESINYSDFEGQSNRRSGGSGVVSRILHGGSRWMSGTEEQVADPGAYIRVGHLDEADTVWAPIHHTALGPGEGTAPSSGSMQCFGYNFSWLGRAADVQFTWAGGTFGSARDITHNVDVTYHPDIRAGTYGFLNTDANRNGVIDWADFNYLPAANGPLGETSYCNHEDNPANYVTLEAAPVIQPTSTDMLAELPAIPNANGEFVAPQTGTGFGLYINAERYIIEMSETPADGTVWTLRTYSGGVRVSSASVDTDDPDGYSYRASVTSDAPGLRPPMIPGLSFSFRSENRTDIYGLNADLSKVHTVPDPYLATSQYDLSPTTKQLMFVNLPPQATIRIYTLTGVLVDVVNHNDASGGGREVWNLRNRNNQFVASGVYFFHVVTPDGDEHVGKFTVVNFAGQN